MNKTLHIKQLTEAGVCSEQVEKFRDLFGESVIVDAETCVKHAGTFDFVWAARYLLSDATWAEYERACDSALAEYSRVCAPARAEYNRVCARTFAELYGSKSGQRMVVGERS